MERRDFLKNTVGIGAASLITTNLINPGRSASVKNKTGPFGKNLYWGDVHNHNAVGYAKGSLERSYDIARSHLDFFCFTGHSQWHDMPKMPQNKHFGKCVDSGKTAGWITFIFGE